MILLLMIMTPGIPEYLTGSTRFSYLFFNTPSFFIGLLLNVGLYSTGALLIREFAVKFNKGWSSILSLGCAYGIMEEGVSVHTFVQAYGNPVGLLGIYGRYMGIDWVWSLGLTAFHAIFSIGLPLLLLSTAFSEESRERLLGRRGSFTVLSFYFLTVIVLNIVLFKAASRAMPTLGDYMLFAIVSIILLTLALKFPKRVLLPRVTRAYSGKRIFLLGFLVFPFYALYAFFPVKPDGTGRIPPIVDMLLFAVGIFLIGFSIAKSMPAKDNRRAKLLLAAGLIAPLFIWAEIMEAALALPLTSVATVVALLLLSRLRSDLRRKDATAVV